MYEIEMVGKKLNISQEYEFFQNQEPKENVSPAGPKEEAGRGGDSHQVSW